MAMLLWIAGLLAIVAGMPELAFATWAVIVINALFSFFQEFKADKALAEIAHMLPCRYMSFGAPKSSENWGNKRGLF